MEDSGIFIDEPDQISRYRFRLHANRFGSGVEIDVLFFAQGQESHCLDQLASHGAFRCCCTSYSRDRATCPKGSQKLLDSEFGQVPPVRIIFAGVFTIEAVVHELNCRKEIRVSSKSAKFSKFSFVEFRLQASKSVYFMYTHSNG